MRSLPVPRCSLLPLRSCMHACARGTVVVGGGLRQTQERLRAGRALPQTTGHHRQSMRVTCQSTIGGGTSRAARSHRRHAPSVGPVVPRCAHSRFTHRAHACMHDALSSRLPRGIPRRTADLHTHSPLRHAVPALHRCAAAGVAAVVLGGVRRPRRHRTAHQTSHGQRSHGDEEYSAVRVRADAGQRERTQRRAEQRQRRRERRTSARCCPLLTAAVAAAPTPGGCCCCCCC